MALYPFLLNPALHTKVWGGRQLETVMGKALPTDEPYGESWEMHDTAVVANGPLQGRTLGDILAEYGHDLVGPDNNPSVGLPLLAKILDAADWLSVQLHPNDEQAQALEGEPRGKSEAWYVLGAKLGSRLVIGVKPGTTREQMAQAIRENALESLLVYEEVRPGDVLAISPGTIHALGEGVLIYEIQQSSDTTYRLYDWGRMGLDGKPRALHIDKGSQVANLDSLPTIKHTGGDRAKMVEIVETPFFKTVLYQLSAANGTQVELDTQGRRFAILTCIEGEAKVNADVTMKKGQTVFVPANQGKYILSGTARVLTSFQPNI